MPRPRLKLPSPSSGWIRASTSNLLFVLGAQRELRLRGLSIRRDVGPKDRTCGIDQRASQLHWRCAGDQKNANRLSPTRSCPKVASGLRPQTIAWGMLAHTHPLTRAVAMISRVSDRWVQTSLVIAALSGSRCGGRRPGPIPSTIGQDLTSVSSIKLPIN